MADEQFLYVIDHDDYKHTVRKVATTGGSMWSRIETFLKANPHWLRVSVENYDGFGLEFRLLTEAEAQTLANNITPEGADADGHKVTQGVNPDTADAKFKSKFIPGRPTPTR